MNTNQLECIDQSGLGLLLDDFRSGALDPDQHPERSGDLQRFAAHSRNCNFCREALIDHADREVTQPLLEQLAREHGMSVERLRAELSRHVRKHGLPPY